MMNNEFRVVKIIRDTALIINGGSKDNINIGDKVVIYIKGEPINDPETNENLGPLTITKDILTVEEVYEKMSVCETGYITSTPLLRSMSSMIGERKQRELNVEPIDISDGFDKTIRVGDLAKIERKTEIDLLKVDEDVVKENV